MDKRGQHWNVIVAPTNELSKIYMDETRIVVFDGKFLDEIEAAVEKPKPEMSQSTIRIDENNSNQERG